MFVFLCYFGCIFCREVLVDIFEKWEVLEFMGVKLVFVYMVEVEIVEWYFICYNIFNVIYISDLECKFYKVFGLMKGSFI